MRIKTSIFYFLISSQSISIIWFILTVAVKPLSYLLQFFSPSSSFSIHTTSFFLRYSVEISLQKHFASTYAAFHSASNTFLLHYSQLLFWPFCQAVLSSFHRVSHPIFSWTPFAFLTHGFAQFLTLTFLLNSFMFITYLCVIYTLKNVSLSFHVFASH